MNGIIRMLPSGWGSHHKDCHTVIRDGFISVSLARGV